MNHQLECIDLWHGASLGSGDSIFFKQVPGVLNGHAVRRHNFRDMLQSLAYYAVQNCANFYVHFTHPILKFYSLLLFFVVST